MARLRITADMLREKDACSGQVRIFEAEWPNGWTATKKNCLRAATLRLDLDWAATAFFKAPAQAAYEKTKATARAQKRASGTEGDADAYMVAAETSFEAAEAFSAAAAQVEKTDAGFAQDLAERLAASVFKRS